MCVTMKCSTYKPNRNLLTFDDGQCTVLCFPPSRTDQPFLHLLDEQSQIVWIRFHDLIELSKFARPEEHLGQAEFEIIVIETKSLEQSLQI